MGRRFLDKSKQIHPKNPLRGLIKSNPLPYPSPSERGVASLSMK
nr:MAG TPA: hypothetical protein [Caudoviricetes sp.]